jgi:hypothetical protein
MNEPVASMLPDPSTTKNYITTFAGTRKDSREGCRFWVSGFGELVQHTLLGARAREIDRTGGGGGESLANRCEGGAAAGVAGPGVSLADLLQTWVADGDVPLHDLLNDAGDAAETKCTS